MRAGEGLFRFRFLVLASTFALGFSVPWDRFVAPISDWDGGQTVWLSLAAALTRNGWASFSGATVDLLVVGIVFALVSAALRTWGTAYLGSGIMQDATMQSGTIVAAGPYRYMRNPLYLGTWLHAVALALLMPPSGAIFTLAAVAAVVVALIAGEESFLAGSLGPAYADYRNAVPRLLPGLRTKVAASGLRPRWEQAVLAESYMWGVAGSFAVAGWRYNSLLLIKCVIVSLGVSLVVRALAPRS